MELRLIDIPDREFEVLHAAVLRLLYEYGMLFEHREANEILVRAGNELDHGGRVHLRPAFVEAALEKVPAEGFALYGRDEEKVCRVAIDAIAFRPATGMPFIIDYQTRQRRPATMADARAAVAIRGSERQLREKPLTAVDVSVVSPLRCTRDDTDALLACARHGLPIEIPTSPSLGLSSPIAIDEATIGVDTIMRAMEESGSLIAEAHTIEHLREGALFECGLNQWSSLEEWTAAGQPDLFERAHEKVEEILATHLVPPFEPGVERELKRIEEEF